MMKQVEPQTPPRACTWLVWPIYVMKIVSPQTSPTACTWPAEHIYIRLRPGRADYGSRPTGCPEIPHVSKNATLCVLKHASGYYSYFRSLEVLASHGAMRDTW
jgi:hypothetical protein